MLVVTDKELIKNEILGATRWWSGYGPGVEPQRTELAAGPVMLPPTHTATRGHNDRSHRQQVEAEGVLRNVPAPSTPAGRSISTGGVMRRRAGAFGEILVRRSVLRTGP